MSYGHDIPDVMIHSYQDQLADLGLDVTYAQVRAVDDWAAQWDRGQISLVKLCEKAGWWPLPPDAAGEPGEVVAYHLRWGIDQAERTRPDDPIACVTSLAHDIAAVRLQLRHLGADLRTALVAADRAAEPDADGNPPRGHREQLVRAAEKGASRATVFKALAAADTLADAEQALRPLWDSISGFSLLIVGGDVTLRCYISDPIAAHNDSATLLDALKAAGLRTGSDGPGTSQVEDLAAGRNITITRP
ncbi:hypothetical protein ABZX72_34440 [Streptomyces cyaneofuscatus]|uniref:hypothetical protein n=1 Tax=Streptomyces cyaneofuscatus TaxID=66883 RepID=UPI0033BE415A